MERNRFWSWWLSCNIGIVGIALGHLYFDLFHLLGEMDNTHITMVIILGSIFTSLSLWKQKIHEWHWFVADAVLSLGMVGTLFGFLMVLGQTFTDIDTSSTESMTAAIGTLAAGMSTALVTSLVGLVASLWLKLQLVIIDGE